jgi:hypothetical protein
LGEEGPEERGFIGSLFYMPFTENDRRNRAPIVEA